MPKLQVPSESVNTAVVGALIAVPGEPCVATTVQLYVPTVATLPRVKLDPAMAQIPPPFPNVLVSPNASDPVKVVPSDIVTPMTDIGAPTTADVYIDAAAGVNLTDGVGAIAEVTVMVMDLLVITPLLVALTVHVYVPTALGATSVRLAGLDEPESAHVPPPLFGSDITPGENDPPCDMVTVMVDRTVPPTVRVVIDGAGVPKVMTGTASARWEKANRSRNAARSALIGSDRPLAGQHVDVLCYSDERNGGILT